MNTRDHLLLILAEECAEVAQRITKALRFGLDEIQPEQELTNEQRLGVELCDLLAMMEMLQSLGVLTAYPDRALIEEKKLKVAKYMNYSSTLGLLDHGPDLNERRMG